MNKLAAVAQVTVCFVLLLCISGNGQNRPAELVGYWKCMNKGCEDEIELDSDGTGVRVGTGESDKEGYIMDIRWKVENGKLVLSVMGLDLSYRYQVSSGTRVMRLIDDKGRPQVYKKDEK